LPVAVTSWVIVLRKAFSVVIGIGFSPFFLAATTPAPPRSTTTMARMMYSFFLDRFLRGGANTESLIDDHSEMM